jgi:multicomponent Na+:H+ antiporter subunit A
MGIVAATLSGYVLASFAPWLTRLPRGVAGWLLALLPFSIFLYLLTLLDRVGDGERVVVGYRWVPSLDIRLTFAVDGLSLLFGLLISGIGALVILYTSGYMGDHPRVGRLQGLLLAFMASMLGLVFSDNLISLAVFWELTSITSFLLIGFTNDNQKARLAALQALLITSGGGLALLAGLILLAQAGGSWQISELLANPEAIREYEHETALLILVLLGAFTKSAQFPFHFWLPNAMAAPTPVSAYLHSATMVKAGIYLLARFTPILSPNEYWGWLITPVGAVTMVLGALLALSQTDLKRLLAYSTMSSLGLLTMLLGIGGEKALLAMALFLLSHALYKGALFLVAGVIDHQTGTRDILGLRGLQRSMPLIATAAGLAALSMSGIPPLFGFLAKETVYAVDSDVSYALAVTVVTVLSQAAMVVLAGLLAIRPFTGPAPESLAGHHRMPVSLWLGPVLLAVLGVVFGVLPAIEESLIDAVVSAVQGQPATVSLTLWHGLNLALALSAVTVALGVVGYVWWRSYRPLVDSLSGAGGRFGPERGYRWTLSAIDRIATAQTRLLQSGYLRAYLTIVLLALAGLVGFTLLYRHGLPEGLGDYRDIHLYEGILVGVIILATLAAVVFRSRLAAIASLSAVGYSIALIFVLYGAPDLAMTQFLVETLTVILLVLVFYYLPGFNRLSAPSARVRDIVVAAGVGTLMTLIVLASNQVEPVDRVADYFVEESVPGGFGRNVVNVILVDFRALDTLGEITVLGLAALGVYALLRLRPKDTQEMSE